MAELSVLSVLGLFATPVIEALGKSFADWVTGSRDVDERIRQIKKDFKKFQSLLSDLDRSEHAGQFEKKEAVKGWIRGVREVAHLVEDILDEHLHGTFPGAGEGAEGFLKKLGRSSPRMVARRRTAGKLKSLQSDVDSIRQVYNMHIAGTITVEPRAPSHQQQQQHVAATVIWEKIRERDTAELEKWMKEAPAESSTISEVDARSMAIAVWGEGGQGKTTLVRKIYNEHKSRQFDCWAWVDVSRRYRVAELLASLASQLCDGEINPGDAGSDACIVDNEDARTQLAMVYKIGLALEGKRFVVVFDDVWDDDFWGKIKLQVLDANRSSRIIVTTREEKVASALARSERVLKINKLTDAEALVLFISRLFRYDPGHALPGELGRRASDIVNVCQGHPLKIVAAATMMSTRGREENAWERASSTLRLRLHEHGGYSDSVLMHSYYDLPSHLKRCFLYCAIFPEGRPIKRKQLLRLWVAEGFIELEANSRKTKEEVAQGYLEDLLAENMLQVATSNENGRVKACTIHDEYRKAALVISSKQKFLTVHDGEQPEAWDSSTRRLSLQNGVSTNYLRDSDDITLLRSMFVFAELDGGAPFMSWEFRLLRVLELSNLPITEVPSHLFKLYNLRYLGLRNTGVGGDAFSKDVQKLHQLQTLDLWNTRVDSLPRNLLKLRNLEHLMISQRLHSLDCRSMKYRNFFWVRGLEAPEGIWDMKNLQTLKSIEANNKLVENLYRMEHLRTLSIVKVRPEHCWRIFEGVSKMNSLRRLTLKAEKDKRMVMQKSANTPPPRQLQKLLLNGAINQAPEWFGKLQNLTHLYLFDSQTSGGTLLREPSL